jgi:hypothetical protein
MKRSVIIVIIKMCAEAILFTIIAAIVVGVIGYMRKWDTSLAYSNAFFVAGSFMIIGGALSRLGAGQQWNSFQFLHAESFREMSSSERANYMIKASSSLRLAVLGFLSGILLFLISWLVTEIF